MAQRTVKLGSLASGLNNRLEPTRLDHVLDNNAPAHYLYGADNVDLNEKGYLKRREGFTRVLPGRAHSLWGDDLGAYAVVDEALVRIEPGATPKLTPVREGLPPVPVSYSRGADNDVYWTNGVDLRRITPEGADRPAGTAPPEVAPQFMAGGGSLPAGRYLCAVTVLDEDGESPATPVQQVQVEANGSVWFNEPALAGQALQVYLSGPNGDILTWAGATASGASAITVLPAADGERCRSVNKALMPAGSIVRHFQGRLLVAAGSILYYSMPYWYGIYDPASGYIPFPQEITVVQPTSNGVYVVADSAYWLTGVGSAEMAMQQVLPYGALKGSGGSVPRSNDVFWQSQRGLVFGDEQAQVRNVQEDVLAFAPARSGASLYRERDGAVHVLSTRGGSGPSSAGADVFMDAEVVRKEQAHEL